MRFFNIDLHISVIADIKSIFSTLGHQVDSVSLSGHNWVFNRKPEKIDIINSHNWKLINDEMCDSFYSRYEKDLIKYDAFICTYPPVFCKLFEKFEKPTIIQIPIRYEIPFHNNSRDWINFNDYLVKKIEENKIIPVANSEYDKRYFEFFTNKNCELIPNICDYTEMNWNPTNNKFLFYSKLPIHLNENLIHKSSLGRYKWEDISKFKGIVLIPYNCSTMSMFEFYTANIPLFCPSLNFMMELYKKYYQNYVLSELTWNQIYKMNSGSPILCDKDNDPNKYDDFDIMKKWIKYSDFYNEKWMPHIVYFDSFEEMYYKIENCDLNEISNKMKNFNFQRKKLILNKWNNIINKINV